MWKSIVEETNDTTYMNQESFKPNTPQEQPLGFPQILHRGAMKTKREIEGTSTHFKISDTAREKIHTIAQKLSDEKITIMPDELLFEAIHLIVADQGILPENLRDEYARLIEGKMLEQIKSGSSLPEVLGEFGREMKINHIDLSGQWGKIEENLKRYTQ